MDLRHSVIVIKTDRAQRYNKSAIRNPQSKIALESWLDGLKIARKLTPRCE
ncbi:hypothetical protein D1AOALGA4SA_2570 [Olavius algarvensis Delta 1 endosymbiont]|nr:hypothetical protein D1AOALGA4SA_2570 [Olavius algarvensis Delta 1 endosymbiont]